MPRSFGTLGDDGGSAVLSAEGAGHNRKNPGSPERVRHPNPDKTQTVRPFHIPAYP